MSIRRLPIGVLASGRGSNLQALIDHIEAGRLTAEIRVVICDVEDAQALERARRHGIEACFIDPGPRRTILTAQAEERCVQCLQEHGVELVALAGFMRILKERLLAAYGGRVMNIHPALLPSFPGLEAQRQAFEYGVKVSGCTVHFVDAGVDTGPIIIQATVPVLDDDTAASLSHRILKEEHRIYAEAIQLYAEGRLHVEGRRVVIAGSRATE